MEQKLTYFSYSHKILHIYAGNNSFLHTIIHFDRLSLNKLYAKDANVMNDHNKGSTPITIRRR